MGEQANYHQWRDVEVSQADMARNAYGGYVVPVCRWCGGTGDYVVTRTSNMSDRRYSDYACQYHAQGWRPGLQVPVWGTAPVKR